MFIIGHIPVVGPRERRDAPQGLLRGGGGGVQQRGDPLLRELGVARGRPHHQRERAAGGRLPPRLDLAVHLGLALEEVRVLSEGELSSSVMEIHV
eukprot:7847002-Pyramimonas_sp.AAC.1